MPDDVKSFPFSSYDFFGYLMPGLMFSLALYGWMLYAKFDFVSKIDYTRFMKLELGSSILVVFCIMTVCYFLGHLIGSISHILYDRMLIRDCIGYPLPYLFNAGNPPSILNRAIFFVAFLCLGTILVLPGVLEMYFSYWKSDFAFMVDVNDIDWIIADIYAARFACAIFVIIFLILLVLSDLKMRSPKCFEKSKKFSSATNIIKRLFFTPFRSFTATDTFVSDSVIQKFRNQMHDEFGVPLDGQNSDVFWLATMSLAKDSVVEAKLNNWLNLYGCLKNYSCAFLLLSIIIASNHWLTIFFDHHVTGLAGSRILLVSIILSIILFLRYWIIYFSYYSKYVVRAYAYHHAERSICTKNMKKDLLKTIRFHL